MATKTWVGTTNGNFQTDSNWLEGTAPATGDTVYIYNYNGTIVNIDAGLDFSGMSGTITAVNIDKSYTGTIGTATAFLQLKCTTYNIGNKPPNGNASGSSRIKIDNGSTATTINVFDTSSTTSDTGLPPLQILGSSITSLNVSGGSVGVAVIPSQTATVTTLRVTKGDGQVTSTVYLGNGSTITNAYGVGGTIYDTSNNSTTLLEVSGATYTRTGTGAITTLNADSGTFYWIGTGTITTANISGTFDASKDARAKTITTTNLRKGATFNVDTGNPLSITFTNAPALAAGFSLGDVTIGAWINSIKKVSFA